MANAPRLNTIRLSCPAVINTAAGATLTYWFHPPIDGWGFCAGLENGESSIGCGAAWNQSALFLDYGTDWSIFGVGDITDWLGIAVIWGTDGQMRMYVTRDGQTFDYSTSGASPGATSTSFAINSIGGNTRTETIQRPRLHTQALTPEQALAELRSKTPVIAAWGSWSLDVGATMLADDTGNGHTLTQLDATGNNTGSVVDSGYEAPSWGGVTSISGTCSATLGLSCSASGDVVCAGSASAALGLACSALGSVVVPGAGAASLQLGASASGSVSIPGGASASLGLSAAAAGGVTIPGAASASLGIAASASGSVSIPGTGSASLAMGAACSGSVVIPGTASAQLQLGCQAFGQVLEGSGGYGAATLEIGCQASGSVVVPGAGAASLGMGAAASGSVLIGCAAQATISMGASAQGGLECPATASATLLMQASAQGDVVIPGTASASLGMYCTASGGSAQVTSILGPTRSITVWVLPREAVVTAGPRTTTIDARPRETLLVVEPRTVIVRAA